MTQPVRHGVGLYVRRHFVDEAFVRERVLQPRRRPQRAGEEWRQHGVRQNALARDDARASRFAGHATSHVRRRGVAAVAELARRLRRSSRRERRGLVADQHPRDDVAGRVVAGPAAARRKPRLVVPRDNPIVFTKGDALIDYVREAVVLPRHLVLARELHAHRLRHRLRQDRRVVGHGVRTVDTVAAGAASENDADVIGRNPEEHRHTASRGIGGLGRRPDRRLVALHVGHGARRAHRAVHLIRMQIGRLEQLATRRGGCELLLNVRRLHHVRVARRLLPQVVVELVLAGKADARRPRRAQLVRRLHRLPRLLADDAHEILLDDHLDEAGHAAHRALVDIDQRGADLRRAYDSAVQHARHAHVLHELELAGDHRRHVEARHGRAEHCPLARRLPLRRGVQLHVEFQAGDELAVAHAHRAIGCHADDAVGNRELVRWNAEALRREPQQRLTRGRSRQRQIALVEIRRRRLAPRRRPLIGRDRRVALDQPDAIERNRELLGNQLRLRREDPLAELALAGVGRDDAVGGDGDPRIELGGIDVRGAGAEFALREEIRGGERDDDRARGFQKIAPRESRARQSVERVAGHSARSRQACRPALHLYVLIARSIRVWVKQRHNTPDSAC